MRIIRNNKQAYFNYEIIETIEAGIMLRGFEVKQIKTSHSNISDSVVQLQEGELWIVNMDIPLYAKSAPKTVLGYENKGKRKLLLTKQQRSKFAERIKKTGLVILPLQILENSKGSIKLLLGLGKRKKKIEKRSIIKERDTKRQMDKEIKKYT